MSSLERVGQNCYRLPKRGSMLVEARVYLNDELYRHFKVEEDALKQLMDAASLRGVYGPVVGMPDIHAGFGLPIGGVMAMEAGEGLISAGAVGMDINCGVRLLKTNLDCRSLDEARLKELAKEILRTIPAGVGQKSRHGKLVRQHFRQFVERGVPFLLELGFGRPEDLDYIEEGGFMPGADLEAASQTAVSRGDQLSTIGGGNHFIEIGYVEEVFDSGLASAFGLEKDLLTVLIHTGSRGFGHQICTDYSAVMLKEAARLKLSIPAPGLAAVPIDSETGRRYHAAMACAVNFAFCNRQWITDDLRKAFARVLGGGDRDYDLSLLYDMTHNVARWETVYGKRLLVHRKGATRALPKGHPGNPLVFRDTGHPILIPGTMGTASYVLVAGEKLEQTFYSVNHGAGRVMSRRAARREIETRELKEALSGIFLPGGDYKSLLDEAPQAYKDIEAVVGTFAEIGITRKVARLLPLAVIKGQGREG